VRWALLGPAGALVGALHFTLGTVISGASSRPDRGNRTSEVELELVERLEGAERREPVLVPAQIS
jgi:hypothetical protein